MSRSFLTKSQATGALWLCLIMAAPVVSAEECETSDVEASSSSYYPYFGCKAKIDKTVAPDNDCDGMADGYFTDSVTQELGKCVVYQICVYNKGWQTLVGVTVSDYDLYLEDLLLGTIYPRSSSCVLIPSDYTSPLCRYLDSKGDYTYDRCLCEDVAGINTAKIKCAACKETCRNPCCNPYSICEDWAEVSCVSPVVAECLTRSPGYWGNHPEIAENFLPVASCGLSIDSTEEMVQDICMSNQDASANNTSPQQLQLIRQCTAAMINREATSYFGGSCGVPVDSIADIESRIAFCCDQLCTAGATGQEISSSGCIEDLDAFNNAEGEGLDEMDLCPNEILGTEAPCDADPEACGEARGDGEVNSGRNLGPDN